VAKDKPWTIAGYAASRSKSVQGSPFRSIQTHSLAEEINGFSKVLSDWSGNFSERRFVTAARDTFGNETWEMLR
jgi:hypothetical protein